MTDALSHEPPYPVSDNRGTDRSRDSKPDHEAAACFRTQSHKAANRSTRKHHPLCENSGKRPVSTKGLPSWLTRWQWREVGPAARLAFVAHGQLPPALAPPTVDNFPSVFCCHPGTESVCVASLALMRLKCSFHLLPDSSNLPSIFQGTHFLPHLQPHPAPACPCNFLTAPFLSLL